MADDARPADLLPPDPPGGSTYARTRASGGHVSFDPPLSQLSSVEAPLAPPPAPHAPSAETPLAPPPPPGSPAFDSRSAPERLAPLAPPPLPRRGGPASVDARSETPPAPIAAPVPIAAPAPNAPPAPIAPPAPNAAPAPIAARAPIAVPARAPITLPQAGRDPLLPVVEEDQAEPPAHWLERSAAFLTSMVVHLALLIALAMIGLAVDNEKLLVIEEPQIVMDMPSDAEDEQQPLADNFLVEVPMPALRTTAALDEVPRVGTAGVASGRMISSPVLDAKLLKADLEGAATAVDFPVADVPDSAYIASGVPDGAAGDPRVIVRDYKQALDRITEEVLWMLAERKVLLVWCFDQSESMQDDQEEILARIDRVYDELGARKEAAGDALSSAVVSYGEGFWRHMRRGPTSDVAEIRQAIGEVPVDPSGKEMMCQAVLRAIDLYSGYAGQEDRQMALILVTDESGERSDNLQFLEPAVAAAKQNKCRVYVLGREAVFGYPYAHMRWVHPQTHREHWLPIDRGPETAFLEELQTDGFRLRTDAHPSGFGPYEQSRLARETGGVFFMLPSLETDLVRGERGDYELMTIRRYRPDLRSRVEQYEEARKNPLRLALLTLVDELNPDKELAAKVMQVRMHFSVEKFLPQVADEQAKTTAYLTYLDQAARRLESLERLREQETSPRWQANYDLIRAQVTAYMARRYEYNAGLDRYLRDVAATPVPLVQPGDMKLSGFNVVESSETVGGQVSDPLIARSKELLARVIAEHDGTPWAARARQELERGFGFSVVPQYRYAGPRKPSRSGGAAPSAPRPQSPTIPIPRL